MHVFLQFKSAKIITCWIRNSGVHFEVWGGGGERAETKDYMNFVLCEIKLRKVINAFYSGTCTKIPFSLRYI